MGQLFDTLAVRAFPLEVVYLQVKFKVYGINLTFISVRNTVYNFLICNSPFWLTIRRNPIG